MSRAFKCDRCGRFVSLKKDDPDYDGPLSMEDGYPVIDVINLVRINLDHPHSVDYMPESKQLCSMCKFEFEQWLATGKGNTF